MELPKIYPITDALLSGLSHAEQVRRLVAGGATFIQLREKRLSAGDFYEDAAGAVRIAHAAGVKVLINDRADIARLSGEMNQSEAEIAKFRQEAIGQIKLDVKPF